MNDFLPSLHWTNLLVIPGLLIGYTVHELGHAVVAYFLGDYSQVERGKISLNPFEHISWFGFLAFILLGIGWPKPLQANPYNFKRKYLSLFLVAISGPLASLTLGLIGLLLTLGMGAALVHLSGATTDRVLLFLFPIPPDLPETLNVQAWTMAFTGYVVKASFWLTFISILPLPGMDGFAAIISLTAFFRERKNRNYHQEPLVEATITNTHPILMSQRKRRNSAADIHFKVGTEYHQANQYDDAIARYRQAISNDRNFGPAYINMGLAYLAKGERRRAIQAFRGTVQYADDKRSQAAAWYQLHKLSEITPLDEDVARKDMAEMGVSPWTDTKPRPNWLGLGIASAILFISGIFLYSYLLTQLIKILKA